MARSADFMQVFESYVLTFRDAAWMPDSRGMAVEDFENLENLMKLSLRRGYPIAPSDLQHPVPEPNPEIGLVF